MGRRMGSPTRLLVHLSMLAVVAARLAACSFVHEQIGSTSTGVCIRKECRDPDAKDYTRCEAACRERYQYAK